MKKFFNRKGFTIIELVVAVLVIGILIAIAAPIYSEIRTEAKQTAHDANVRKLSDVAEIWVMNNPGVSAIWTAEAGQKAGVATAVHEGWMGVLKEWPGCPFGGTYVVEIDGKGGITVSPGSGEYGE